ncbi:hypothetical protein [Mycobacterium kyorinense]|uniref:hypothetical protein n=1 Tax=Mycobacterium kyorinense TaxID=487514 RepID=UPI0011529328|nr:hypothetical protein [Mycobacterium kyorinense]
MTETPEAQCYSSTRPSLPTQSRYCGGGGATGWQALAPGFHQLPGPQSGGGGGVTGWQALAPGFHQLPGPQSGG